MPNGIIIIDKPAGWTSMDVCAKLRGILHEKCVGHAGTLDPMATGVLPVFVGQATKAVSFAENGRKVYEAVLQLGTVTDTQDTTGETLEERADIRSLRAFHAQGVLPVSQLFRQRKVVDRDAPRLARNLLALAGKVVELLPVHLDGRVHRRDLLDLAEKARQRRAHLVLRDGHGALFEHFAGRILRVGHKAEL